MPHRFLRPPQLFRCSRRIRDHHLPTSSATNSFVKMVFKAHAGLHIDHIPDDIILPDLVFNPLYGRRPVSESNSSVFIDAPSGKQFTLDQVKERTESFAKGLKGELNIESDWKGVIGVFAPNHVIALCYLI
jgi:hypothetical protein